MYILTLHGKETEGAYSVQDDMEIFFICLKMKMMLCGML